MKLPQSYEPTPSEKVSLGTTKYLLDILVNDGLAAYRLAAEIHRHNKQWWTRHKFYIYKWMRVNCYNFNTNDCYNAVFESGRDATFSSLYVLPDYVQIAFICGDKRAAGPWMKNSELLRMGKAYRERKHDEFEQLWREWCARVGYQKKD